MCEDGRTSVMCMYHVCMTEVEGQGGAGSEGEMGEELADGTGRRVATEEVTHNVFYVEVKHTHALTVPLHMHMAPVSPPDPSDMTTVPHLPTDIICNHLQGSTGRT